MTGNTFADKANQEGTNTFGTAGNVDSTTSGNNGTTDNQLAVMQKRITDKDTHITTLETENRSLREMVADVQEKLNKLGDVETLLERMQNKPQDDSNRDTALDEETLVSKTLDRIQMLSKEQQQEQNFTTVANRLTKEFGADKVDEKVNQFARENGLTFDEMVDLAKKSPQAVYRMVGLETTKQTSMSPSHSTIVGYGDKTADQVRDQKLAEFAKLRRENPRKYWSSSVQQEFRKLF